MNQLLKNYLTDTQHPGVSGIEHVQMLRNRTKLSALESSLSSTEHKQLSIADQTLTANAQKFLTELSNFIDLAEERERLGVSPEQWWWYLDILAQLPDYVINQPAGDLVTV